MSRRKIFVFGDTHFKWHHKAALNAALKRVKEIKPDAIVQIGDLYDMLSYSRFAKSQNFITPDKEIKQSRDAAIRFWEDIKHASRKSRCYQIVGNHDIRPLKKLMDAVPEYESVGRQMVESMMKFEGVKTILDPREELLIDDVIFLHGYHSQLGAHMLESHENVCCGHSHRGGVIYHPWNGKVKWELNVGYIADKNSVPLSYTQRKRFSSWTVGWGEIDSHGPRFVPFKK